MKRTAILCLALLPSCSSSTELGRDIDEECPAGEACDDNPSAPFSDCDSELTSNSADAVDYARALGLCSSASVDDGAPGVLSAVFSLVDGSGTPHTDARSIRTAFGDVIKPLSGDSLVVLSTGRAAAPGDIEPRHESWQPGVENGTGSGFPQDWLEANGGTLPNAPTCPELDDAGANDSVMLTLNVRVPQDAHSFTMRSNFMSSEYPEWVCSPYNDFFVVLLDSQYQGSPANPADKNLAVHVAPDGSRYPVGVNLAALDTGLFTQCKNGPIGCGGGDSVTGSTTSCTGTTELGGTGMDTVDPEGINDNDATCGANDLLGGGTGWLEIRGNVVPGEVITLRVAVWDTGDSMYDSVVVLDDFEWHTGAGAPGTHIVQ